MSLTGCLRKLGKNVSAEDRAAIQAAAADLRRQGMAPGEAAAAAVRSQMEALSTLASEKKKAAPSKPAPAAAAPITREQLTGLEVPPKDGTDSHLKAVADRVKRIETEAPDTIVRTAEDGKTVTAAEELARIRREAAEGTDIELGALDADLIRVAAECALSAGTV
jgi:hypothetical protein